MIVYHGSNHCFRKLKIARSLVEHASTLENEGLGIYFSTDKNIAKSYGKYIYILELNENKMYDFRNRTECQKYVHNIIRFIKEKYNISICQYFSPDVLIDRMTFGGQCIFRTGKEICDCLESNEQFYFAFSEKKRQRIYHDLLQFDKGLNAYMFSYSIKNIGVIKNIDENIVKIIKREKVLEE